MYVCMYVWVVVVCMYVWVVVVRMYVHYVCTVCIAVSLYVHLLVGLYGYYVCK